MTTALSLDHALATLRGLPAAERARFLDAIYRDDFVAFIERVFEYLTPGTPYMPNWHVEAVAFALERVRRREIKRLIINLPPRSLKSIIASVAFPAFVMGRDPSERIICVSYANDLAAKHANDFRTVVTSEWFKRSFPAFTLGSKISEGEVTTSKHGSRLSTSIGGVLTGRGGNLILIDDPIKPADALSQPRREQVNHWYSNTLLSRLDDKINGAIVIVMQRVHLDDLAGYVTRDSDDWHVLSLPAIAPEDQIVPLFNNRTHLYSGGSVLHREREPLSALEAIRLELGSDTFSAQYQQSPVPPGGAMIKRRWLKRFETVPTGIYNTRTIQSWDTALKGGPSNDWSVCATFQIVDNDFYLIDIYRARHDYPALKQAAIRLQKRYNATRVIIEDVGTGTALIQELRRAGISTTSARPTQDKVTRMSIESAKIEAGFLHLPKNAFWLPDFEAELLSFPGSRYDDQVDAVSQALAYGKDYHYGMLDVVD